MKAIATVLAGDVLSKAILAVATILMIRWLAPSEYAIFSLFVSVITMFGQIIASSLNTAYLVGRERLEMSANPTKFLGLQLALVAGLAVILLPIALVRGLGLELVAAGIIGLCLSEFAKTDSQRDLNFRRYSRIEVMRSGLYLIGVVAMYAIFREHLSSYAVLAWQSGSALALFAIFMAGKVEWKSVFCVKEAWQMVRKLLSSSYGLLFLYFGGLAVLSQTDIWMLKWISNEQTLAAYASSYRYYVVLLMVLGSVNAVYLPMMQRVQSLAELDHLMKKQVSIAIMALPVLVALAIASPWIVPLVDGGKYPEAVGAFRVLCLSAGLSILFSPHVNLLKRQEDFLALAMLSIVSLGLAVGLNIWLIPQYGATGAAWATFASFGILNFGTYLRAKTRRRAFNESEWSIA